MSLRAKTVLILVIVVGLYAAVNEAIQHFIVYPSFDRLEREQARKDCERCTMALRREISHLDTLCRDWAAWDDTYEFIADRNPHYIESTLLPDSFKSIHLDALFFYGALGNVVWSAEYDAAAEELVATSWLPVTELLTHSDVDSTKSGIVVTEGVPRLVASRPIVKSDGSGPIRGTLVMVRALNEDLVATLSAQTRVKFTVTPIGPSFRLPGYDQGPTVVGIEDDESIVQDILTDIAGVPALLVEARIPREITPQGGRAVAYAEVTALAAGLLVLASALLLLEFFVVARAARLSREVRAIGEQRDLTVRVTDMGRDEVGLLASEINRMVGEMAQSELALRESETRARELAARVQAENERLHAELALAVQVQRSAIPEHCVAEGLDIAHYVKSSGAVGGDFLGVVRDRAGNSVCYVGDVSGHGLGSAMVMNMLVALIEEVVRPDTGPAEGLAALQSKVYDRLEAMDYHATICLCHFSADSGRLSVATAGHPWPMLVSGGEVRVLDVAPGMPLGMWRSERYSEFTADLGPGDRVLMFSDGLSEARLPSGGRIGVARVQEWFRLVSTGPTPDALARLVERFGEATRDQELEDDATIVLLQRVPMTTVILPPSPHVPGWVLESLAAAARGVGLGDATPDWITEAIQGSVKLAAAGAETVDSIRLAYGFGDGVFQASATPMHPSGLAVPADELVGGDGGSVASMAMLAALRELVDHAEWRPAVGDVYVTKRW